MHCVRHIEKVKIRIQEGFSLIEVMIALFLIGLITSTVISSGRTTSKESELEKQARRFAVVMNMASDYGVLNQRELGLRIEDGTYHFVYLDEEQKWQPLEDENIFSLYELPQEFSIELELEDLPWQEEDNLFDNELFDEELSIRDEGVEIGEEEEPPPPPQVLLLSSGEFTPFRLTFIFEPEFGNENPVYFRVDAEDTPPLTVSEPLDRI